jgi:hypothetical protein
MVYQERTLSTTLGYINTHYIPLTLKRTIHLLPPSFKNKVLLTSFKTQLPIDQSTMKLSIIALIPALAATMVSAVPAAEPEVDSSLEKRDVCGSGYPYYTRRTNSPCASSNGDRRFCGCDRTGIVSRVFLNPALISTISYLSGCVGSMLARILA